MTLQKIKNQIKYIVRKYFGYDLSTIKIKLDQDFLDQKKLLSGKDVSIIFDAGANAGQTTHKYRKIFPKAFIYGFEPYPDMFVKCEESIRGDKKARVINVALSNTDGTAEFFVNSFPGTNSLLPNNEKYTSGKNAFQKIETIEVKTETLDSYCKKNKIERINILKMDIQGGELLALKGAEEMLMGTKVDLIYTEVMFVEVYKNQPLFKDIENFLKNFGYTLYKKYNIGYENGKEISGDVIFIGPSFQTKIYEKK